MSLLVSTQRVPTVPNIVRLRRCQTATPNDSYDSVDFWPRFFGAKWVDRRRWPQRRRRWRWHVRWCLCVSECECACVCASKLNDISPSVCLSLASSALFWCNRNCLAMALAAPSHFVPSHLTSLPAPFACCSTPLPDFAFLAHSPSNTQRNYAIVAILLTYIFVYFFFLFGQHQGCLHTHTHRHTYSRHTHTHTLRACGKPKAKP